MDVFEQVAAALGRPDGAPAPLDGGLTNRNFRWGDYVIRIPGSKTEGLGIDRAGELVASKLASRLGIGPEVLMDSPLVTRFVDGYHPDAAELRQRADEVHAILDRLHTCGETLPVTWDAYEIVMGNARAVAPPADKAHLLELAEREPYTPVPCHNDLMVANFIATPDGRLVILDWEYAGMGDPRFDEANFAMHAGLDCEHRNATVLSLLREAMWGVVQASRSDLDFDYEGYADEHFARLAG